MNWKKAAVVIALILACALIVSAKDYSFNLGAPVKAGNSELSAGDYKLALQGSIAIITDVKTQKSFTTMVKVETGEKKYDSTAVETITQDGQKKLTAINVGGSTTRLAFQ